MEILRPEEFNRVDIRVGTIIDAQAFPEARKPAYRLIIDLGDPLGRRHSSAQLTDRYSCEDLVGRQILAVVNFPPKRIAGFLSEVLTLGVSDGAGSIVLVEPESPAPNGSRLF
ncbi:MAG TPA: tRNA-binding protein [Candidatus Baltobacteraceae bacterium]|jgi:tRNA-binding protein|nr:tRNA-binding protein [Candidatus Baltobacteraceae bacterium]